MKWFKTQAVLQRNSAAHLPFPALTSMQPSGSEALQPLRATPAPVIKVCLAACSVKSEAFMHCVLNVKINSANTFFWDYYLGITNFLQNMPVLSHISEEQVLSFMPPSRCTFHCSLSTQRQLFWVCDKTWWQLLKLRCLMYLFHPTWLFQGWSSSSLGLQEAPQCSALIPATPAFCFLFFQ